MRKNIFGILILSFSFIILITSSGCYYDNEEELYGNQPCDTANVKYSTHVKPILENRCYACHSNAAAPTSGNGISIEGYANISNVLTNFPDNLFGAINHTSGFEPMPKNSTKLSPCDISKITIWFNDGFPDN